MRKITKTSRSNGFTLLELLVVLAIVGIITYTAIPHYKDFRARAYDFRAQNDLRMVALAEEAHFLDNESYLSCSNQACESLPGIKRLSSGVLLSVTSQDDSFLAVASHNKGTGRIFQWDSELGALSQD